MSRRSLTLKRTRSNGRHRQRNIPFLHGSIGVIRNDGNGHCTQGCSGSFGCTGKCAMETERFIAEVTPKLS